MTERDKTVELLIYSDGDIIERIEQELKGSVEIIRGKEVRDGGILTIIAIIAGTLKIANELIKLKKQLEGTEKTPKMEMMNLKGA
jgi:hypothetical protein